MRMPSKGAAWLEVLNEDGYRLRGFTKEDAWPMKTDDLSHEAAWKEKKLCDLPPGNTCSACIWRRRTSLR